MKAILSIQDLTYTEEVLQEQKTGIFSSVISILCLLVVFCIAWIFFGKKEDVVRVSGMVRPIENISFVKTFSGGKVRAVYFKSGQYVEKGDLLLTIDDTLLEQERQNLEDIIFKLEKKLDDIRFCFESIDKNIICVPLESAIAYKRMENYFSVKNNLEKILDLNIRQFEEERLLPGYTLTKHKLKMLNLNVEKSKSDLEQYKNSFLHSLFTEKEALELQKKSFEHSIFKIEENLKLFRIRAPISGEIQELSSLNCGDNVFSGQEILKIIPPAKDNLRVVLQLPSSKSGVIREHMKVRLKFPAFPRQEFGCIEGEIEEILPDVLYSGKSNAEYAVFVKLNTNSLFDKKGFSHSLKIGLYAEASIIIGVDSILAFILQRFELK